MAAIQSVSSISPLKMMDFWPTLISVLYMAPLSVLLPWRQDRSWPAERPWRTSLKATLRVECLGGWPASGSSSFSSGRTRTISAHKRSRSYSISASWSSWRTRPCVGDGVFNGASGAATVILFTLIVATHAAGRGRSRCS